ncbi:MAG: tyrosine-type recombinase/integrase [Salinivirgaceae bacterium]|jgi:integrase|nr:tyrosine-type recombinase/integrase [Desulfobacterales bacterium]MDY0282212.1 tyrosine-type recombinase/integrase [Salinivirgaceae bacterium]
MAASQYTLSPAEVRKLIFNCETLRERIIIRLMVHCGLRREEVARLLIDKIDWERNRISFIGKGRQAGMDIETVQGLVRHKSFKTTYDLYGTLGFDEIQKSYEKKFLDRN